MQVSHNWLNSYIDLPYKPLELEKRLTMAGLEVEKLEFLGSGLEDIIIGKVLDVKDHENADKLNVCQVDCGEDETYQIVCGADNVRKDLKVPVALPGTTLPGGMEIGRAKLRGVQSNGMICSADELELAEERQPGIMELPDNFTVGKKFIDEYSLNDYVYKLDLTPNYSRCLGMLGIARELSALADEKLEIKYPENNLDSEEDLPVEIEIGDESLCSRYTARLIKGIEIGPSPVWMQRYLKAAGIRPINNVVDITNFVMLEYNQPLHAFDYDKVAGDKIIIRRADQNEELITLDGQQRELDEEVLVIADKNKAIGLAGVMGGEETEVTAETENILLETASFDPVNIRTTARKFALPSESSHRFERKVDIKAIEEVSARTAYLFVKYAGAEVVGKLNDKYPSPEKELVLNLKPEKVNGHLGIKIDKTEIRDMLEALGFSVEMETNNLKVRVPSFRTDVEYQADLIEEVTRVYGYNNIPYTRPASKGSGGRNEKQKKELTLKKLLQGQGLDEAKTFSLWESKNKFLKLLPEDKAIALRLKNPLSEAFANLRTTLVPGLIDVLASNSRKQVKEMAVHEIGQVFFANDSGKPGEKNMLAMASMGAEVESWDLNAPDFFYLKGIIENLFAYYKLDNYSFEKAAYEIFHPGRGANILVAGKEIGMIGEIHPDIQEDEDLPARTAVVEINLDELLKLTGRDSIRHGEISRYPSTARDLALIVSDEVTAGDIIEVIKTNSGVILEEVELFDYYKGSQIPEGKKSLALKLTYLDKDKTIKEEDVAKEIEKIIKELKTRFELEIRGD
ncbi:MAG: phenylalanine--tRNA ligase subunit beta [Halarsenatibacteraceae bacterium]